MALSKTITDSLEAAEGQIRNALAFAARAEKPYIAKHIADMVHQIDTLVSTDALIDKLENRNPGDKGMWGPMVDFE